MWTDGNGESDGKSDVEADGTWFVPAVCLRRPGNVQILSYSYSWNKRKKLSS